MNSFQKVLKSKTVREALENIPYSFFDIASFAAMMYFIINPLIEFILYLTHNQIFSGWKVANRAVLLIGLIVLMIYVAVKKENEYKIDLNSFLKNNIHIALLMLFALLMIISTLVNGVNSLSLFGYYYRGEGLFGYLSYIVYFLLMCINKNDKYKKIWINTFIGTAAVIELYYVSAYLINGTYDISFVFSHFNHYGYYLLMVLAVSSMWFIISSSKAEKAASLASVVLSTAALVVCDTLGCIVAAIMGFVMICIIMPIAKGKFSVKYIIPPLLFVLTFILLSVTSESLKTKSESNYSQLINDTKAVSGSDEAEYSTGTTRIVLWQHGLQYILEKPVFGHSADATGERLETETNDTDRCHCEYMNYAISFGIPAAVVYFAAMLSIYLRGLKHKKQLTDMNLLGLCSALFYLFSAAIGNTMYYTAPFLFILAGFGYYTEKNKIK